MYKVGIIGAGAIVESNHLPVLKNISNVSVAWVYDQNEGRSLLLSRMYNVPAINGNWETALEETDVCLLSIPYGARKPYLEKIAERGKAVYVEKPFALNSVDHERWCGLFPPAKLAVGFQRRYYDVVWRLKTMIESGVFGRLQQIIFRHGNFSLKGGTGYLSDAKLAGGGVTVESAIHGLDQILCFTGATDIELQGVKSLQRGGIDYDTTFDTLIRNSSGTVSARCEISTLRNLENGIELDFETAAVHCQLSPSAIISVKPMNRNGNNLLLDTTDVPAIAARSVSSSFHIFWTQFFEALSANHTNMTSGTTSMLTTKWIEKIYVGIAK